MKYFLGLLSVSGDQIKRNEMSGVCRMYDKKRGLCQNLVGKPEVKRPLGRPRL
jgi:hypothetical protein